MRSRLDARPRAGGRTWVVEIEIGRDELRTALQELLRLGSANIGGAEAVREELAQILGEWRADPARLEARVAAFASVAGGLTATAAIFATREARDDQPTDDEILQALRDVESAIEEMLGT